MNRTNFKKYISYVKEKRKSNIEDQHIEKDYFISLFLSTWQKLKDAGEVSYLDNLIFKGGTLLARNYLDYPRISEDIDFTYVHSNDLRKLGSKNKREKAILKLIAPIIDDIKLICDSGKFVFDTNRTNRKYIIVRNSRAVYILNVYHESFITGEETPIKIELNFLEHITHDYSELKINNIVDQDLTLKSIGYDLSNIKIYTYHLDEIIIEKYRAIFTRDKLKERDVFDLYLINKICKDVFGFDNTLIFEKIESGYMISPDLGDNLKHNCTLLHDGDFGDSDDDISRLTLVKIDDEEYEKFKSRLYDKLSEICKLRK
jgi:predicted nucleotidyltransferase component of viral defense system